MHHDGLMNAGVSKNARHLAASGVRKRHVNDEPFSKKSGDAILRPVEKLVWDEKLSRTQILLWRTNRAYGDDPLHSQQLHRVNVRAVIDLARQDAMPAAVARQKRHALSFQRAKHDGIGRIAERRFHANLARVRQSAHGIEPAPSADADRRLGIGFGTLRFPALLCRHLLSL